MFRILDHYQQLITFTALNLVTSLSQYSLITCRTANPKPARPCKIGFEKPTNSNGIDLMLTNCDDLGILLSQVSVMMIHCIQVKNNRNQNYLLPPMAANDGSICSGLESPDNRYIAAWKMNFV